MSISPEVLDTLRTVAQRLGDLRERVVFVGGAVRGLLITDNAVEGSRATKDVDVIAAGIATTMDYYEHVHRKLRALGFKEDKTLTCRWTIENVVVDVMPPTGDVLGFSNRWYEQAVERAETHVLPAGAGVEAMKIRVVNAPLFLATKLEAFNGRGKGDYESSHDIEDIVALVDGRPSLPEEVQRESPELRIYLATELVRHLQHGLRDAIAGHLPGDPASQERGPRVEFALVRIQRPQTLWALNEAAEAGEPGGTNTYGPWRYEILSVERRRATPARDRLVVQARLTNLERLACIAGDGRNMRIEDGRGTLFPPLQKLLDAERLARNLPLVYDQVLPDEPFETCWVYELPREAKELRLLLPNRARELLLDAIAKAT